jgi:glycosidase
LNYHTLKAAFIFLIFNLSGFSQDFSINKIEPPNWWVGMKWDTVQLMVYGENLGDVKVISEDSNLKILGNHSAMNGSYLFLDVLISTSAVPGTYHFTFSKDGFETKFSYQLLSRKLKPDAQQGFSNEDVIYLIMADRFCDGNPENNTIGDSLDHFTSADIDGRKGGDIEGIISKLDYIKELGVTSIWITPMLENNMWMSYHGYAATDLYKIDPRFGSNELYKKLVKEAHDRGIKVILDHVSNHIGINHYWVKSLPASDWFHGTASDHLPVSHDKIAFVDIHGDSTVVKFVQDGWFTDYMPDLNQQNPFLKNYLIQNTLWWVEYSGLDGIREDTYPYSDQKYLSEWAKVILEEYPSLNIVGEIWQGIPSVVSAYQTNSPVRKLNFDSHLPVVTDFALSDAIRSYIDGDETIYAVYKTIAEDNVYANSDNLLVFFDNHDIQRAMFLTDGNIEKIKLALNLVLFTRGIPVILYGTEIGIKGGQKDGELRETFPGGFISDKRNAFDSQGRTEEENNIYNYLKALLNLRKDYTALSKGKLTHIYSRDNLYYLIKTFNEQKILIILNTGSESISLYPLQLKMVLKEPTMMKNIFSNKELDLKVETPINLEGYSANFFLVK